MAKIIIFLVLAAVATDSLATRIARSPGGAGWGNSGYDSGTSNAGRSSGWNSFDSLGKSGGLNGWSSPGFRSSGPNGWGNSGFGRISGSWGQGGNIGNYWSANSDSQSDGFGVRNGHDSSRSSDYSGTGIWGSGSNYRSNNGWQSSW